MKKLRRRKRKNLLVLPLCICLIMGMFPGAVEAEGAEVKDNGKEKALEWLEQASDENGFWGKDALPNETCNAIAVLTSEQRTVQSSYLEEWMQQEEKKNTDELCHLVWAYGNEDMLNQMMKRQNEDGGFGLNEKYTSDVYDTMLVLDAAASVEARKGAEDSVQNAVTYLIEQQNEDGGYGYTSINPSDTALTADVGIALILNGAEDEEFYAKLDTYCQAAFRADFSEECFEEQARLARYLYMREQISNAVETEEMLQEMQLENGSIYDDVECTIQYILLMREIERYHALKFQIKSMQTEADTYVLEVGENQKVNLDTKISYQINQEQNGTLRYTLLQNNESILTWEETRQFQPEQIVCEVGTEFTVCGEENSAYTLRIELWMPNQEGIDALWQREELSFYLHKTEEEEFLLESSVSDGTDYGVRLYWNDITNEDGRYGYRVFRRQNGGEWETRSVWDGEEKVKVLNIYPTNNSKVYLTEWMTKTIGDSEEPAGMGLFEIDTVSIDDYCKTPDSFLMDEEGLYKYDVLVFGTADCNGGWDLNQKSYEATKRFVDAGGGVLFGHDTVSINAAANHPYFAKFAEDMGIILKRDSHPGTTTEVKVIKQGFLTNYPWNLSGTLEIPPTHVCGQYAGGTTGGTIWMECQHPYEIDEETGAINNGYLITSNSLAIIQTGHSNGKATDDERKVFANTIFYLKQLTNNTSAVDKSFYDLAVPDVPIVESQQGKKAVITAEDNGTQYEYYVEAIPMGEGKSQENRDSNIITAEACSGIQGYIVGVSDSEAPMEDLIDYAEDGTLCSDILIAEEGRITYDYSALSLEEDTYLHVYAVDWAGNISEEMVTKLEAGAVEPEHPEEPGGYFDTGYALFSTDDTVIYCSNAQLYGKAYVGTGITFGGSSLFTTGAIHSTGIITTYAGSVHIAERIEHGEAVELPDYRGNILAEMTRDNAMEEISVYNSTSIQHPVHCQSTTGAYCPDLSLGANLLSENSIYISANQASFGGEVPIAVCSAHGDININATALSGSGLIYAPEGTVTINVSQLDFKGSIIAKRIYLQGDTLQVGTERE